MAKAEVLIHPGFHKTGTTYLQNVLFADTTHFQQPWPRAFIDDHIMRPHPLAFDADVARSHFAGTADNLNRVRVLSEEGLGGNPFNGAREAKDNADKLAAIFGKARILITVRSQCAMIRSLYIQYLKSGGRRSLADFLDAPRNPEFFNFDADVLCYHRLAEYYLALFGPGSVLVLPQEYIRREPASAVAIIGRHVGMSGLLPPKSDQDERRANPSPPLSAVLLLRGGNHFSPGPFNETGRFPGALAARALRTLGYRQRVFFSGMEHKLQTLIEDRFATYYAASNRRLQALTEVSLETLGYAV